MIYTVDMEELIVAVSAVLPRGKVYKR
ncbi:MAG: hypothetical protein H0Z39_08345 [Peptococcaceae bacterium]|nr:hypothetical protein [Peptococcaceae bacterium]